MLSRFRYLPPHSTRTLPRVAARFQPSRALPAPNRSVDAWKRGRTDGPSLGFLVDVLLRLDAPSRGPPGCCDISAQESCAPRDQVVVFLEAIQLDGAAAQVVEARL